MRAATIVFTVAMLAACATAPPPKGFAEAGSPEGVAKVTELAIAAARRAAPSAPQDGMQFGASMGYLGGHRAELFDANKDGRYGFVEWLASSYAPYLVYNTAKDGRITEAEFIRFRCGPDAHPFSLGCSASGSPGGGVGRNGAAQEFKRLDHGAKGYLASSDLTGEALGYFRANDVNRDGWVTDAEVLQTIRR
ncbi:MAG TPA: hypothetical protein VGO52_19600 [Hyphomonadaceae bacterium]|jgi:hypothetical protein|nr:hypothetical protein [Hyphomonadaceae bacterium]